MVEWMINFPEWLTINPGTVIDTAIRDFSRNHKEVLNAIKTFVIYLLNYLEDILGWIPWWMFILLVIFIGYKITNKLTNGLIYGGMLLLIGIFGLWTMMLETLSIIIFSVLLALIIGFPLGLIVASNRLFSSIMRPIMDFMQTIPTFVYLVPAAMLFSVGKTPAVFATLMYSIVPIIRMTSHGITHVDKEMVEAGTAFGATRLQLLLSIQIPQAFPIIMTGVNQTIMMAMGMVVTCALIGANGLGMEILIATNRTEMGRAMLPGISIVFLAIILDRLTQGAAAKIREKI